MELNEEYDLDDIRDQIDLKKYVEKYIKDLEFHKGEWWGICPLPNHKEDTPSFSVNENTQRWYCFGCGLGGDIFSLVMQLEKLPFYKTVPFLAELLGIETKKLPAIMKVFRKYKPKNHPEAEQRVYIDPNSMKRYNEKSIDLWLEEGIQQEQLEKYDVRIDERNNRIVFPIWDNQGKLITISGRTLNPKFKELGIQKYIYYSKIGILDFFYGFWQNKNEIEKTNSVILFEGAKSVMKAEGWGYHNCMAVLTSHISDEQIVELVKTNCREVVFALDSEITRNDIEEHTKMLRRFKLVSYIHDKDKLLKKKMAPVDMGKDIWNKLFLERRMIK